MASSSTHIRMLVIVVAVLCGPGLVACGSDDDSSGETTSQAESSTAEETTSSAAEDGELETSDAPFTAELPGGWEERSRDELSDAAEQGGAIPEGVETLALWAKQPEDGYATNVNVISEEVPPGTELEQFEQGARDQLGQGFNAEIGDSEQVEVGDDEAFQFDYTADALGDGTVAFRVVGVVRDGRGYSITLSSLEDATEEANAEFEEILASWSWS